MRRGNHCIIWPRKVIGTAAKLLQLRFEEDGPDGFVFFFIPRLLRTLHTTHTVIIGFIMKMEHNGPIILDTPGLDGSP